MIHSKGIKQTLLTISIFSLVTVILATGLGLYHASYQTTVPENLSKLTEPLDPSLDLEVFESIKSRRYLTEEELKSTPEITKFEFASASTESAKTNNETPTD